MRGRDRAEGDAGEEEGRKRRRKGRAARREEGGREEKERGDVRRVDAVFMRQDSEAAELSPVWTGSARPGSTQPALIHHHHH
ncbi:hypothetical protein EYF80_014408 [Liparis tanakae]|uniref:Uncharacterized protein n=1 Tax=Liparis tanakae TaxID=230148 RepID=A0A4Z2ICC0_9TELE|nr:hypothetical protein EYF80_014408 [Liparis tanakae]